MKYAVYSGWLWAFYPEGEFEVTPWRNDAWFSIMIALHMATSPDTELGSLGSTRVALASWM